MKLQEVLSALPFLLLCGLVPYFFYNQPNIAQSIILVAICGLCGFQYYLMEKKKPDYIRLFKEEFKRVESQNKDLKENYGKMLIRDMKTKESEKFVF